MTAEIAVMNQQAAALAADSAVTITGEHGLKIFASADKIFALSEHEPVGVMVYGSASLLAIPWETIIKVYRSQLGAESFESLPEYAADFLRWLGTASMFPTDQKHEQVRADMELVLNYVLGQVTNPIEAALENGDDLSVGQIEGIIAETVGPIVDDFTARAPFVLPDDFAVRVRDAFDADVADLLSDVFQELPLTDEVRERLRDLAFSPLLKALVSPQSGLVFAGFGRDDYLPRLRSFEIDGVVLDQAQYIEAKAGDIVQHGSTAYVAGFAQEDVINLFMEGVLPQYQEFIETYLVAVIDRYAKVVAEVADDNEDLAETLQVARQDLLDGFAEDLSRERYEQSIDPILDVVGSLPKDELAALAESLVNLTSLKRRVSHDEETVAGPVDVAVISKGDGFVWIQRKQYFDPNLNARFFANYYSRRGDVQDPAAPAARPDIRER